MSNQFKSVELRLAPPSRGQHVGAVVLDVLHRRNRVIIRSMRPSGQAGASPAELAPRKPFSSARRVDRAALAPHRAPGAQAVRVICFSCGRTRPATICQAPGCVATRGRQGQAMARHVLLELELDQEGVARGTCRDRTVRAPRSRSHCSCRPHLLRAGPRSDAPVPTCPPPRGRARSTGRRRAAVLRPRFA